MIFQVSAMLLFTVTDVFKAMFEIDDLDNAVDTFGQAILREELSSRSHKDLANHETIGKALLDRIRLTPPGMKKMMATIDRDSLNDNLA